MLTCLVESKPEPPVFFPRTGLLQLAEEHLHLDLLAPLNLKFKRSFLRGGNFISSTGLELLRITMTVTILQLIVQYLCHFNETKRPPNPASKVNIFKCSTSFSRGYFLINPLYIVCHSCINSRLVDSATAISPADNPIEVRDFIFLTGQRSTRISLC